MIKIEDVEVWGFRKAIKGMRNAMNSWDKSDSNITSCLEPITRCEKCPYHFVVCNESEFFFIGDKDMDLAKRLIKAGSPDRKFMRMIHVQADVTAPLYWWKEYDTYKVGTTANSCSTMHTIHKKEFTIDDFSYEHLMEGGIECIKHLCNDLNLCRNYYLKTKSKDWWWQMIQLLPSSFNQMRTIDFDYETLFNIYHQRKNHKLTEWREFCDWITTLPYMKEFLGLEETNDSREAD